MDLTFARCSRLCKSRGRHAHQLGVTVFRFHFVSVRRVCTFDVNAQVLEKEGESKRGSQAHLERMSSKPLIEKTKSICLGRMLGAVGFEIRCVSLP